MNATTNILHFSLPGTACRPSSPAAPSKLRADLLALTHTASLPAQEGWLLCGENVLLPAAQHPRFRYACCVYLVSQDGRKALPVVSCRGWFHAPLPAQTETHPVWEDLRGGLAAAAERLALSPFNLEGAVTVARSWMQSQPSSYCERRGSTVLLGGGNLLCCETQFVSPPLLIHSSRQSVIPWVRPLRAPTLMAA